MCSNFLLAVINLLWNLMTVLNKDVNRIAPSQEPLTFLTKCILYCNNLKEFAADFSGARV